MQAAALGGTLHPLVRVLVAQRKVQFFAHLELDDVSHKSTASVRSQLPEQESMSDDTIDTGTEGRDVLLSSIEALASLLVHDELERRRVNESCECED
jgi:hypothetical protein